MISSRKAGGASIAALCVAAMLAVLLHESAAVTCDPSQLSPCLGAISGGSPPSTECCNRLKEQVPCYCSYLKNPSLRPYIESPNAKKVASSCGIAIPSC